MRLIDADALEDRLHYRVRLYHDEDVQLCVTANQIDITPTIDAVPVVRCADCKYLNESLASGGWDGSCRYWNTHSVTYSWFCSQGQRREDDDA